MVPWPEMELSVELDPLLPTGPQRYCISSPDTAGTWLGSLLFNQPQAVVFPRKIRADLVGFL